MWQQTKVHINANVALIAFTTTATCSNAVFLQKEWLLLRLRTNTEEGLIPV